METGPNRRIRAIISVDSAPQVIPELPHEKEFCTGIDTSVRCRILGAFKRQDLDLLVQDLQGIEALRGLCLFHGDQRGTNFPVTQKEGEVIMSLTER